jgi:hypothetical protein
MVWVFQIDQQPEPFDGDGGLPVMDCQRLIFQHYYR